METHPLIDEAMKKAAVVWLTVDTEPAYAVWCLPVDGALYVVSGPGEQPAPGLMGAAEARVTARGDHGGRIVTWPVSVTRLWPDSADWEDICPQLATKRLNASGTAEAVIARWAADNCVVARLAPAGAPVEAGATLPADSLAAPPIPTPATRLPRNPFRLHRVRQPR